MTPHFPTRATYVGHFAGKCYHPHLSGAQCHVAFNQSTAKGYAQYHGTVVLNCCFAPLFIFVFDWGISGAAFATILAQFVMLMWQLKLFSNKADLIHLNRRIMRFKPQIVKESLIVGLPQFLINLCACLVAA